jgi:hypothetical protein
MVIQSGAERAGPATLDGWIVEHGPLSPGAALFVALDACSQASRMSDARLRESIASLHISAVSRGRDGAWAWRPVPGSGASRVGDALIVERIGILLFTCLTGQDPVLDVSGEQAARSHLRRLRPDVPAGVADLTARALSAREGGGAQSIEALARDLRQLLVVESAPRAAAARVVVTLAVIGVLCCAAAWGGWRRHAERRAAISGLTDRDERLLEILHECSQWYAMVDEHTSSRRQWQEAQQVLREHVPIDDPRLGWLRAHEAWVQTLADDRLSAEQMLEDLPIMLSGGLGASHPYVRAVRLELADTLAARGAAPAAAALREAAARDTRALLPDAARAADVQSGVPAPPGVLAHASPNAPEREGFRRQGAGAFAATLTSTARWLAGRDGWRLHVVSGGTCRASFVAGVEARRLSLNVSRASAGWTVRLEGTRPALEVRQGPSDTLATSLVVDSEREVRLNIADRVARATIDTTAAIPRPPYTFAFEAGDSDGRECRLVWAEIPFPWAAAQ